MFGLEEGDALSFTDLQRAVPPGIWGSASYRLSLSPRQEDAQEPDSSEGEELSFWELSARARRVNKVALGHRRANSAVALNPSGKEDRLVWGSGDFLIVIGEMKA